MNFYSDKNVYEAAKERVKYIWNEFPDRKKLVTFSGGKDSTVTLYIVHEAMQEMGINDKIPVMFLDQEIEAPQTIDYIRYIMNLPWVEPHWIQSYFREWNASAGEWFNVWGIGEKWIREKETDRQKEPDNPEVDFDIPVKESFCSVLDSCMKKLFGDDFISFGGMRVEESPARRAGLTYRCCYKDVAWGAFNSTGKGYSFYPLWDWHAKDIWFYIFSNHIKYCELYNYYMTKRPLLRCRVSSFIHENSISSLKEIKEIAPAFFDAAYRRVKNINTTIHSLSELSKYVTDLPVVFSSWSEYIEYLCQHIVGSEKQAAELLKHYRQAIKAIMKYVDGNQPAIDYMNKEVGLIVVGSILSEDFELSQLANKRPSIMNALKDKYNVEIYKR